ncbi:heavy metal-associated domain-containing protein, partial [Algoriella sp.]|uniref:heavy-metal-associated domain-containing protein n=1 Tax=Algoriella sp. TaxID=1872434 RepID=UPI001B2E979D
MDAQNIIIPILNLNSEKDVATLKTLLTEIENIEEFTIDLNTKSISITAKKLPKVTAKVYEALKQNKFEIDSVQKTYPVLNMTCASCASSSQANLQRQIGVVNAEVNYGNGMGKIEYIPNLITPEKLKDALNNVGF